MAFSSEVLFVCFPVILWEIFLGSFIPKKTPIPAQASLYPFLKHEPSVKIFIGSIFLRFVGWSFETSILHIDLFKFFFSTENWIFVSSILLSSINFWASSKLGNFLKTALEKPSTLCKSQNLTYLFFTFIPRIEYSNISSNGYSIKFHFHFFLKNFCFWFVSKIIYSQI